MMSITEISVKRPAAIVMVIVLMVGLGIMGYTSLGADLLPSVNTPVISIVTTYKGAGVEEIEKDIVKPIEDEVSGIKGVDKIRSGAAVGYGYTTIMFTMKTNVDNAFMDVQQVISDVSNKLPKDASKPVVRKFDKNAQPVMMLSVSGKLPYEEIYSQADRLKQSIEKLEGVGNVTLQGALKKQMEINIDKIAIEGYGISINTVMNRLMAENLNIPAGQIKQGTKNTTLRVIGEFDDVKDIENLQIPVQGGSSVRLADIAEVKLKYPDSDEYLRLNGTNAIGVFIQKQSDANIVATTDIVKKELTEFEKGLPKDIAITIADDESKFINETLKEVQRNVLEGILTTSLVMLLFLRRWRSSIIVLIAIPTSLIATFFMMYVSGFTLNLMSLLGLSVCIGILVDDSIVVLENIQRHLKMGKNPIQAAIDGRKEIGMAAIAITLCDVVVFGPVAFMSDMIGQFFREFGLTVVYATLFSLAISFTVTPMMAAKLLGKEEKKEREKTDDEPKRPGKFHDFFAKFPEAYKKLLLWSLDNRWKIVALVIAGVVLSVALIPLNMINFEFIPNSDQSRIEIDVALAPGTSLDKTDQKIKTIEQYVKTIPEVKDYFSRVGNGTNSATASVIINLVAKTQRKRSQDRIAQDVRNWGKKLDGVDFTVSQPSIVGRTSMDGSKPVIINITGSNNEALKKVSRDIEIAVKSVSGVTDVDNSTRATQSEYNIKIDRLASAGYGISALDIANTLRTAIQGSNAGVYRKNGDEYDIIVKFKEGQINKKEDVGTIKVSNSMGQQVFMSQVSEVSVADSPQASFRLDRQGLVTVSANIQGRTLGTVNNDIKEKLKSIDIPKGYSVKFGGDQENMNTSFSSMSKAMVASILLVYMILVVLYESYLTPFIRMLSFPCGIIGAFFALVITGRSLNLVTMIGLIMLDGLASKNGTLLIDYTNTLMKRGLTLKEALIESGTTRLKPIIMTSITMIVGMLPTAMALGEGSEIKSGMAIALIGGMVTSTLLSPILLPVVYTMMDDLKKHFSKRNKNVIVDEEGVAL